MKTTKSIILINILYALVVFLFINDAIMFIEIKSQTLKHIVYYGVLIGSPLLLIINIFFFKTRYKKLKALFLPASVIIFILFISPLKIIYHAPAWNTIQVLENKNGKRYEFQKQDM